MRFRLAPRSMTLEMDDLELENNLFSSFRRQYLASSMHRLSRAYLCVSQLGFLVKIGTMKLKNREIEILSFLPLNFTAGRTMKFWKGNWKFFMRVTVKSYTNRTRHLENFRCDSQHRP